MIFFMIQPPNDHKNIKPEDLKLEKSENEEILQNNVQSRHTEKNHRIKY